MPWEIIYLCSIAFAAGLVQGFSGFGVVLVSLPLMAFVIDIKIAIPLVLLLGMAINIILVIQLARHIEFRKCLPLLAASLPGIPMGVYTLKAVGTRPLEILVGAMILLTAGTFLFLKPGTRQPARAWGWLAGLAAGFLGGSIGAAGPPVVIYTTLQPWTRHQIKSTMVGYFFTGGLGIIAIQLFSGIITPAVWRYWGLCLIPLVLGVLLGIRLYSQSNETIYQSVAMLMLTLLGFLLLLKG
ncbi:MAG: sulfite exporter TauE/SafE family protein [Thermodesulfobacteriota bacterium]|nr:sulfite exporter TauE/SafE family protein [Thermodesulfobacteriota bacterium]